MFIQYYNFPSPNRNLSTLFQEFLRGLSYYSYNPTFSRLYILAIEELGIIGDKYFHFSRINRNFIILKSLLPNITCLSIIKQISLRIGLNVSKQILQYLLLIIYQGIFYLFYSYRGLTSYDYNQAHFNSSLDLPPLKIPLS